MLECAHALIHGFELNVFLPFNTIYLCQITFSALTHIKSLYRSSLKRFYVKQCQIFHQDLM